MSERPRLRGDLQITRKVVAEGDCWVVNDLGQGKRFWFGPAEHRVLSMLDGRTALHRIATTIAREGTLRERQVYDLVAAFRQAGLLVDPRAGAATLARVISHADETRRRWGQLDARRLDAVADAIVTIDVAPGSRCADCALRCCSYRVDVGRGELPDLLLAAGEVGVSPAALVTGPAQGAAAGMVVLQRTACGECALLAEDGRCRVHAASGLDRKPLVCQLYPGVQLVTPDGPRLALTPECTAPDFDHDPGAVGAARDALARSATARPNLAVPVAPEHLLIGADRRVPWADYAAWESDALATLRAAPSTTVAATAVTEVALDAVQRFDVTPPEVTDERRRVLAGGLSSMLADVEKNLPVADALEAIACEAPAHTPRPCPAGHLAHAVYALLPLRSPTLLAGLGVLRLAAEIVDHHARGQLAPVVTVAETFRAIDLPAVRESLAGAYNTLEGWALAPS